MKLYDNIPIYIQIANDIKEKIVNGEYGENDKLPSIREFCLSYEVTSLTLQRAVQQLEAEGVIFTKKGIGIFISKDSKSVIERDMIDSQINEFITRMKKLGLSNDKILTLLGEALKNE